MTTTEKPEPRKKNRGGRPKNAPEDVKNKTIGVRVSPQEFADLEAKATALNMTPAQFLRTAALTRRLPPPPVPAINIEQYAELAKLAANLNRLTKLANQMQLVRPVIVDKNLLAKTIKETQRLRQALLGIKETEEW